jgi:hypothetical protein
VTITPHATNVISTCARMLPAHLCVKPDSFAKPHVRYRTKNNPCGSQMNALIFLSYSPGQTCLHLLTPARTASSGDRRVRSSERKSRSMSAAARITDSRLMSRQIRGVSKGDAVLRKSCRRMLAPVGLGRWVQQRKRNWIGYDVDGDQETAWRAHLNDRGAGRRRVRSSLRRP